MSRARTEPNFGIDLRPELEAAIAEHLEEVEAIATGPWPPSFADTIAALERAGVRLDLAERLLDDASAARSTPAIRGLEADVRPRLAAHRDAVGLDPRVFARIANLVMRRDELGLDDEQRCVLERYHRDLVRAGATLGEDDQARLRAINGRLSVLGAEFRRRLHEETAALAVHVGDAAELDGLSPTMIDAARRAAREHAGADGDDDSGFRLTLSLPSVQPALEYLHDRALRERLWRASLARGRRGGGGDNRAVVAEIAALRAERAGLLGFASHAEYALADQTAGSVGAVEQLLAEVGGAAVAVARTEGERHLAALRADGHNGALEPWDWPYYAERERRERHALDELRLREYFELDRVLIDGAFDVAQRLYGLRFEPCEDAALPHPDVRVWRVSDEDGGDRGRLYLDAFAREGKRGGAWMDAYAQPAPLIGRLPLISLQLNVTRPAGGAPALLTPLDVRILFHEFGHALQMLLSDVVHPRVGGLNVATDVVEFASKLHESLALRADVVRRYARHHETGAALGDADVAALEASVRSGAAAISVRGVANEWLDQAWHGLAPGERVADVEAFEAAVLERHGLVVPGLEFSYRSAYFIHIFEADYAGTHYAYLWSARLEAVALEWLDEQGGLTRAAGRRLRDEFLSRGATVDPLAAFRAITGREPSVASLLHRRGLLAT
ncbi:MAG: peptidyl-dipeptidase Dcp [Solirubrobacteraceae bacterium]|nr:peptidyl-dipeptidase Dcp [Solirubrobacteraceae bacterium]